MSFGYVLGSLHQGFKGASIRLLNLVEMFVFVSDVIMSTISQPLVESDLVDPPSSSDVFSGIFPIYDYVLTFSYMEWSILSIYLIHEVIILHYTSHSS